MSFTALQVKWLKDEKVITPSKRIQSVRVIEVNTLRISEVTPQDEGKYKCIVSNKTGSAEVEAPLKVLSEFFLFE